MNSALSDEIKAAIKQALLEVGAGPKLAFSVRSFAQAADMGQTSVRAEIKAGRLKARRLGDRLIIPAPDAYAYLAACLSRRQRDRAWPQMQNAAPGEGAALR